MDLFGHRARHANLLIRIDKLEAQARERDAALTEILRTLATRLDVAEALATIQSHAAEIEPAIGAQGAAIQALRNEHTNVRLATTDMRHVVECLSEKVASHR
jgi:uncharacterized protein YicC (UPF0701 family)